jgi:surfeit locus 1 family protein
MIPSAPICHTRRLLGAVLALAVLAALLLLGVWQMQRLAWKQDLIARQEAALSASPQPLEGVLAKPEAERLFWPVTVTGQFADVAPFVVGMRPRDGKPGYHLVLPFMLTEGPFAGREVLVNLGWSPLDAARSWRLPPDMAGRTVTLDGLARLPEARTWLTPQNQPGQGAWYTVDPAEMIADKSGTALPLFLQLRTPLPGESWPLPLPAQRDFRNDHRQYAIFWFIMAGVWVVMVGMLARRRGR